MKKYISTRFAIGIRHNRYHQPLRPVSCKRRTPTAIVGMNTTKAQMILITGMQPKIKLSKTNHHNSERRARPLNVAYLPKQVLIDSKNPIIKLLNYTIKLFQIANIKSSKINLAYYLLIFIKPRIPNITNSKLHSHHAFIS